MIRYAAWLMALAAVLLFPLRVACDPIIIEAEDFAASHDLVRGKIRVVDAPGCHGGKMMTGLDHTDEWTSYAFNVDRAGDYAIRLVCRGEQDASFRLRLTFDSADGKNAGEFILGFFGKGYG